MAGRRLKQARVLKHPVAPFSVRAFCIILHNFILITRTEKSFRVGGIKLFFQHAQNDVEIELCFLKKVNFACVFIQI